MSYQLGAVLRPKQLSYPVFLSTDEILHKYGFFEARQGRMYSAIVSYYVCFTKDRRYCFNERNICEKIIVDPRHN